MGDFEALRVEYENLKKYEQTINQKIEDNLLPKARVSVSKKFVRQR